jgi:hypothetical protein
METERYRVIGNEGERKDRAFSDLQVYSDCLWVIYAIVIVFIS